MDIINGYQLVSELKNDKSGYARWGFATKDGIDFFIKEFLSPVYPLDVYSISPEQIMRKREVCDKFQWEKQMFYDRLNQCFTGNVVTVADFFRWGSHYYMVTERIDAAPIDPKDIMNFDLPQKLLILKIILYGMNNLHRHGIVHGDIKPDNILFKRTAKGMYTAKLIDFDSSFTEDNMPMDEEFQGDMVYLAPESFLFIAEEIDAITTKIDVFALGILFHQYFSGELPEFDTSQYDYAFEAVLDGAGVKINPVIPDFMKQIIERMLDREPENRPSVDELFETIRRYADEGGYLDGNVTFPERTSSVTPVKSGLIINMRKKDEPTVTKADEIPEKEREKTDVKDNFFVRAGEL